MDKSSARLGALLEDSGFTPSEVLQRREQVILVADCPLSPEMLARKSYHQSGLGRDYFGGEGEVRGNAVKDFDGCKTSRSANQDPHELARAVNKVLS